MIFEIENTLTIIKTYLVNFSSGYGYRDGRGDGFGFGYDEGGGVGYVIDNDNNFIYGCGFGYGSGFGCGYFRDSINSDGTGYGDYSKLN
jgi:hypothetical protein